MRFSNGHRLDDGDLTCSECMFENTTMEEHE